MNRIWAGTVHLLNIRDTVLKFADTKSVARIGTEEDGVRSGQDLLDQVQALFSAATCRCPSALNMLNY